MSTTGFRRRLKLKATAERLYDALTTLDGLRGWWTTLVSGAAGAGGTIRFEFVGLDEHILMRVDEAERPSTVRWSCLVHASLDEWKGTTLTFAITAGAPGESSLDFEHVGLTPDLACYQDCRRGWDHFLLSLVSYVEQGRGSPFGGEIATETEETLSVVRAYHAGWTRKNFDESIRLLSPSLAVEVPINEYPTAESFASALSGFGRLVRSVTLLSELAAGSEAMLLYDMVVERLGTMRVAEHFTVAGGKITRIRQIHDTAAVRAAGFG